jgi:hypothetical protein
MSSRKRTVSIRQWAVLVGLADDSRSSAVARALITQGDCPRILPIRRRHRADFGVRLPDHERWARSHEWAKFLVAEAAKNRRK